MTEVTSVPLLDLKAQYNSIRSEIEPVIKEVIESQYFILGPKVVELEQDVAKYSNTKHAIGVSSGTDALLIALIAIDIKPGDEIITTPYSFFATAGVIARLDANPVFVDIEEDTYNIDPAKIEAAITDKTLASLPVQDTQIAAETIAPINEVCIEMAGMIRQPFDKEDLVKVHQGIIQQCVCFSL